MLPKITELEFERVLEQEEQRNGNIGMSFLFDFDKGDFALENGKPVPIFGLDALKQWVNMTLRTEKYRSKIYADTEHGVIFEGLIGSNFPQEFIEAELQREITESLLRHPLIDEIKNWNFSQSGSRMKTTFTIVSPLGESEVEHYV